MEYFNQIKVKRLHVSPLFVELLCNSPEMHAGSSRLYCFYFHFSYNIKSKNINKLKKRDKGNNSQKNNLQNSDFQ